MGDLWPKLQSGSATTAEQVDAIVETLVETASNNIVGDGKSFVQDLEKVIRIRDGETDKDAL